MRREGGEKRDDFASQNIGFSRAFKLWPQSCPCSAVPQPGRCAYVVSWQDNKKAGAPMSDLRDFNTSSNATLGTSPIADPAVPLASGREDGVFIDRPAAFDETIGGEPLNQFHVVEEEEPGSSTIKIAGAFAVALLVGAAAFYGYEISSSHPSKVAVTQTASNAPAPAMTPPPSAPSAASDNSSTMTPPASKTAATMAPAETSQPVVRSARRTARARSEETAAASSSLSATATLATPPVEPVSPTPPASALAANPNPQPALSAPEQAAPDSAAPAPAAPAAAPAPESTPAVPPPDQAPAQ